ncbi:hypothetical protein RND81_04G146000 [Saponaria officinalis]|uniref:Uncharacterized protein n=1 Tax=Saponaria officinalis TaxID=3572 RepID=A0AAW1LKQ5_SAPOF
MELQNPNNGGGVKKPKIIIIMGPTGSGKSKLAIDLATHFPIEVINADSMQVYHALDVLTNKVSSFDQKGVPHHLLGTISPNVEFNSKDFRDASIPLIEEISSRNHLPVIVGGTNFYIQALVSPFLLEDALEDMDDRHLGDGSAHQEEIGHDVVEDDINYSFEHLRAVDPVAANRVHPNDNRKIRQYLELFFQSGILPSKLFQVKINEKWGSLGDNSRYDCCIICVDASLPVLDQFVDQRVDQMIEAGLLDEACDIYTMNADYTRGLRQAIGVGEFEDFLCAFVSERNKTTENFSEESSSLITTLKQSMRDVFEPPSGSPHRQLLEEAILKMKLNTRRLVRRQKRRLNRLQTLFGWNIHYVDSTESLQGRSEDTWIRNVVEPAAKVINSFLTSDDILISGSDDTNNAVLGKLAERDLWTQYICEACGNRVLRGAHEWEQHKQGRGHRKRVASLKKRHGLNLLCLDLAKKI